MADVQRFVDNQSSGGDGTTRGHSGATAAYASFAAWEGGEATDLVSDGDEHYVNHSGTALDTATTIFGWTTGASNRIMIR